MTKTTAMIMPQVWTLKRLRSYGVAVAVRNPACQTRVSKFHSLGFLGEDADSMSEAGSIQGKHLEYHGDWKGANKAHSGFAKTLRSGQTGLFEHQKE